MLIAPFLCACAALLLHYAPCDHRRLVMGWMAQRPTVLRLIMLVFYDCA